jgi:hypothetical protein
MHRWIPLLVPWLAVLLLPVAAPASPRAYAWSYQVTTGLEGDSGTELWASLFQPTANSISADLSGWDLWWGMTTTPLDSLELAFYAVGRTNAAATTNWAELHLEFLEAQARWRLARPLLLLAKASAWPGEGFGGSLLLVGEETLGDFDLVLNAGPTLYPTGPGAWEGEWVQLDASTGASYRVSDAVRVGLEALLHAGPSDYVDTVLYVGPTVSYGKGRFWAVLNGTMGPDFTAHRSALCARFIFGANF